jgi:thiol-disulfide isomerase/thioredoxin
VRNPEGLAEVTYERTAGLIFFKAMIDMKQLENRKRFWTTGRLALTAFVFVATAFVISSCKSNDTANLTSNSSAQSGSAKPKVTITSQSGSQTKTSAQPQSALDSVPALVWNTEIQAVDGASFKLADYKDKVVVLDVWATWCGPCRMEIPHLVDLSKEYAGKGVEVIGLTTESPQSDAETVRGFAKEMKINYKLGYARADIAQSLMNGQFTIPQTFVIAPGGRIVTKFRGFNESLPEMIRAAIDKANEKTNGD